MLEKLEATCLVTRNCWFSSARTHLKCCRSWEWMIDAFLRRYQGVESLNVCFEALNLYVWGGLGKGVVQNARQCSSYRRMSPEISSPQNFCCHAAVVTKFPTQQVLWNFRFGSKQHFLIWKMQGCFPASFCGYSELFCRSRASCKLTKQFLVSRSKLLMARSLECVEAVRFTLIIRLQSIL